MSRFIEVRERIIVNLDHIVRTSHDAHRFFVLYMSNGHEVAVDHKDTAQFIEKLLTNQPDQSTIKVNQDSNQPEKGKK